SRKTIRREIDQAKATPRKAGCRLTAPVNCPSTLRSWEWLDRGIALELERLAPSAGTPRASDPGENLQLPDLLIPATHLLAVELPPDTGANVSAPNAYAAASAQNSAWRGAALYAVQGNTLVDLGATGSQRAALGVLAQPLAGSAAMLFEPEATAIVDFIADDFDLAETDLAGLAAGANRLLVGGELMQFQRAQPLGGGRWRIAGLLRGRGGTEPEAAIGHAAQTPVILIDDSLIPLDPALVPSLGNTRVAAMGTGDPEAVVVPLVNAGLARRPPCPVHPQATLGADQSILYRWTRRARGQWRWDDGVDVPLVEEREAYLVGYGPVEAPHVLWQLNTAQLHLAQSERAELLAAYGSAQLWVRQVGTFDHSAAVLLAPSL
ncbi:GTA baseplate fiber-binding domain-containing protein, partial [Porphyrobacter sp. TH134]|uniref:GTA baseplate fiber-binding domain-containing protein n=1 Tax=Porphyrobacter sp. TH134 TaxID=2067450 RepID=UPI003FA37341